MEPIMDPITEKKMMDLSAESKYRRILIAAKRSKQIQKGAKPRVNIPGAKPTRLAMEEVAAGLVNYELIYREEDE